MIVPCVLSHCFVVLNLLSVIVFKPGGFFHYLVCSVDLLCNAYNTAPEHVLERVHSVINWNLLPSHAIMFYF